MVSSKSETVAEYVEELPFDRREAIEGMRTVILQNLPGGYVETMRWGMISYEIPLEVFPDTYNHQPLSYIGLAAQKNYNSLYLMSIYSDPEKLEKLLIGYEKKGLKPKMGKSCLYFKKLSDLPLETIIEIIKATTPERYIDSYKILRSK